MRPFDAVLIDMDGTLTDSEPLWHIAEHELIRSHSREVDPDIQKTFTGVDSPTMIRMLREAYRVEASAETLLEQLMTRIKALLETVETRPGAVDLLKYLQAEGIRRALVSNSARELVDISLAAQPWRGLLEITLSAEEVANPKPAPDLYLEAARRLEATPERCLVIEDSLTGTRAAVAAGMTCAAVPSEPDADLEAFGQLTPHIFPSLREVQVWLEGV